SPPPLSFAQQRLWFLDQLEPGTAQFNMPIALRLTGALDVAALQASLQKVVERHEMLRTTFMQVNGRPVQKIHTTLPIEIEQIDLRQFAADERVEIANNRMKAEIYEPFDLEVGPLVRVKLYVLNEAEYIILFNQHHIITDGWSTTLMWRELTAVYNELVTGTPAALPELPIQYGDYSVWQQNWLESDGYQAQLDYWQKKMRGTLPTLDLPLDRSRAMNTAANGAALHRKMPADLMQGIKQLGRAHGATLFMTVLTAFKALLYRYTGQEDLLIGTSIANRNRAETSSLIGFFVNTLLLRTDISEQPSFADLLDRVRKVAMEAFANQDMPVEKLIELLQPERDSGRANLFDVLFIFQNTPEAEGELANVKYEYFPIKFDRALFDLTWYAMEQEDGLEFLIEYNADLFDEATIERLFVNFQKLLESIVAAPAEPIAQLPLLPAQELDVLDEWRQTQSVALPAGCVHEWFEAQVAANPGKTAVSHSSQHLTYAKLNAKANQLAHYLIEKGVQPDSIVGLHMPRSIEMIVALLGVLKAGGAYLPLDPDYPAHRLQYMLEDARPLLVLTADDLSFAVDEDALSIVKIAGLDQFNEYSVVNPKTAVSTQNLAYIIYTSGTTGKPKGVQIEHQAMANFVHGAAVAYPITSEDRVLQFATIAFDTAVEEIYPCLTQGATLVLRTETMIDTMDHFLAKCAEWNITVLDLPTAFWHHLTISLVTENLSLPPNVKLVIIGGEKANEQAMQQWQEQVNADVRLLNTYGPTEATVVTTMYEASAETSVTVSKGMLIGRPLPNYDVYVLDAAMQPVPIGVAGELLVGGPGLSRGYLNRFDLTVERFVESPFGNGRLYKTGDLVRFLPDGNLEFMGRTDDQVKIRGYRIELGEIEAALTQHDQVQQAVVIAYEPTETDRQLAAYLIGDGEIVIEDIHQHLQDILPAYMVPASFTVLDALPLMP
ncbi:MAG: amino acid adenylation domain-containing protein, partial [Chloroflexi bacterium]